MKIENWNYVGIKKYGKHFLRLAWMAVWKKWPLQVIARSCKQNEMATLGGNRIITESRVSFCLKIIIVQDQQVTRCILYTSRTLLKNENTHSLAFSVTSSWMGSRSRFASSPPLPPWPSRSPTVSLNSGPNSYHWPHTAESASTRGRPSFAKRETGAVGRGGLSDAFQRDVARRRFHYDRPRSPITALNGTGDPTFSRHLDDFFSKLFYT